MDITLQQLLESRDERQRMQHRYLSDYPELTLMVVTVVMPGTEKRNHLSSVVSGAAMHVLREEFNAEIRMEKTRDLETGFEGWFLIDLPCHEAKRRSCTIEDAHPLGRLFDIDIFDVQTTGPLSRTSLGLPERRCILCDEPARMCMRSGVHSRESVMGRIREMVTDYESMH